MKLAFATLILCVATLIESPAARADDKPKVQPTEKAWTISVTPYIWAPSVNGNLSFTGPAGRGTSLNVAVNPGSYLNKISAAVAFAGEIRKGSLAVFTDVMYVNSSTSTAAVTSVTGPLGFVSIPITVSTQQRANEVIWTLAPSLTVMKTPASSLDVFTGFRYASVNAGLGWQFTAPIGPANVGIAGSLTQSQQIWDWVGGVRGKVGLGDTGVFVPYYLDAGTGTSAFTWQGILGLGYAPNKYWDLRLVYRHLSYNEPAGGVVQQLRLSGPALGAQFRF
jgi:opacity protein-like surface antigen